MENIKRRASIRIPAKASVWYIASSAIARAIGALGTPIFTRLLTPEEYGLYPLYGSWLSVFSVIITLELTGAAMYRGLQRHGEDKDGFISAVLGLTLALFLFFCVIYAIFGDFINTLTGLDTSITRLMLTQILASAVLSLYTASARFEYKYKTVALLNVLSAIFAPAVAIVLIRLGLRAEARILGSSLTLAIIAVPILITMLRRSHKLYSPDKWLYLLRRALPLLPHYFSMTLILKIAEITVSRIHGAEALGKISVALSVGMSLTVITGGLLSALSPWMLRRVKAGEISRIRDLLLILTKLISLSCLGLLALAPEAMALLASSAFHSALPTVYPIALSVIPTFLSGVLMSGGVYFEKSGLSALPAIMSASFSTILSLTLIPILSYKMMGLLVLLSYSLLAILNVSVFTKMANEAPIFIKKTLLLFLAVIGYGVLLFLLRNVLLSRMLLLVPLILPLFSVAKEAWTKIKE